MHKFFENGQSKIWVINMKISLVKAKKDENSFWMFQHMGFHVSELEDLEKTDEEISNLVRKTL